MDKVGSMLLKIASIWNQWILVVKMISTDYFDSGSPRFVRWQLSGFKGSTAIRETQYNAHHCHP